MALIYLAAVFLVAVLVGRVIAYGKRPPYPPMRRWDTGELRPKAYAPKVLLMDEWKKLRDQKPLARVK